MCEDTKLKARHRAGTRPDALSSMCEDTKLKAIHNYFVVVVQKVSLSSMCEDTKLKAIHN